MSYLTDVDEVIFLAGAIGLGVGVLTSAQDMAFEYWLDEQWVGWDRAISKSVVSAIVWALVLSAITFITILYAPVKPLSTIRQNVVLFGLWMGLLSPGVTRFCLWATDKLGKVIKPDQS
ncbi:MAG: hypothetical protein AAFY72_12475 [Cyanobacteria bacterium J06649_4]